MMKWAGVAIGAAVLLMAFFGMRAGASTPPVWVDHDSVPVIKSEVTVEPQQLTTCHGVFQTAVVEGIGRVQGCAVTGALRALMYRSSTGVQVAVSKSPIGPLFPIEGLCEWDKKCEYLAGSDRLIARTGRHIQLIDDVSQKVTLVTNEWTGVKYYTLNQTATPVEDSFGDPLVVGAFGTSRNGQWMAIEFPGLGTGLVDLASKQVRRVIAPGYQYGIGMDPVEQMAVSNDGKTIVVTGENAGFAVVSIDDLCGDIPSATMRSVFAPFVPRCPSSDVGIGATSRGFWAGYAPEFHTSERLSVMVLGRSGGYRMVTVQPQSVPTKPPLPYLALGDSFSSGEGEVDDIFYLPFTNAETEKCHTSWRSYPYLADFREVRNVACSGARLHDVVTAEPYVGQHDRLRQVDDPRAMARQALDEFIPGRIPQSEFVETYQPGRLTVGIGGNDAGMMDKLQACAMPTECRWVSDEGRQQTLDEINRLYPRLVGVYKSLQRHSPTSVMAAVGYPKIIGQGNACDALTNLVFTTSERRYMNEAVIHLNKVVRAAAHAARILYVDVEDAFTGTSLCDVSDTPSMNGFRFGNEAGLFKSMPFLHFIGSETFHPTPFGHELIARRVSDTFRMGACGTDCDGPQGVPAASAFWTLDSGPVPAPTLIRHEMISLRGSEIMLSLPRFSFAPNSSVRIEVYSQKTELGERVVDGQGALAHSVTLPSSLEAGFHTVYVYGETEAGESVGYYQTIAYNPALTETQAPLQLVAPASRPGAPDMSTPEVMAATATAIPSALNHNNAEQYVAKMTSDIKKAVRNWVWLLPLLSVLGIMTVWYLFARRSKK